MASPQRYRSGVRVAPGWRLPLPCILLSLASLLTSTACDTHRQVSPEPSARPVAGAVAGDGGEAQGATRLADVRTQFEEGTREPGELRAAVARYEESGDALPPEVVEQILERLQAAEARVHAIEARLEALEERPEGSGR